MAANQKHVAFLSGISQKQSLIPDFAKERGRITRKKQTFAPYTSDSMNTFRVVGEQAEYETANDWEKHRSFARPDPLDKVNEPLRQVPFPVKEASVHHIPHSRNARFIRTNVRFINKPIWFIDPDNTESNHNDKAPSQHNQEDCPVNTRDFYSASYIGRPGQHPPESLETTYKGDYLNSNRGERNTRHGSNYELRRPAHGILPVNELRQKDGKQRVWTEKMSYKQIYDSRATPNYTFGLKKQGAFVWNQVPPDVIAAAEKAARESESTRGDQMSEKSATPPSAQASNGIYQVIPTVKWERTVAGTTRSKQGLFPDLSVTDQ